MAITDTPFEVVGEALYDQETDTLAGGWTALLIPVEGPVQEIVLSGGLDQLQQLVGGFIEAVAVPHFADRTYRSTAYINESGKFEGPGWTDAAGREHEGLPFNGRATDFMVPGAHLGWGDYIAGPMLLCGFDPNTGEHAALPQSVIDRVRLIEREAS